MSGARSLFKPVLICLTAATLAGLVIGHVGWTLAAALAVLLAWQLRQTLRLRQWLQNPEQEPPEAKGIWGDLFDGLYHRQRKQRRDREQLLAVIARMQDSTSALRDAVIMLDAHGNLEWWNPSTERLLGLKSPQDVGQPILNLIRHPQFKTYFEKGDYQQTLELTSPVQDALRLQFQITEYGQGLRLMLARDVTHIHQLEQMRKDFVANVSHELRTPLTVITGYLETLLEHGESVPPRWQRALNQMQQQGARMQHLLDDLLLLARLEATEHPSEQTPQALAPLLNSIYQDAQLLSDGAHTFELAIEPELYLKGSYHELRSAFSNLIFNAVKYTPKGGAIMIHASQSSQGVHIEVRDTGPGIDARHIPRLTERFYRIDSSRHSATGGTGLGLAIVKHVLLRHNGKLTIESEVGVGSCFRCDFPHHAVEAISIY